MRRTGFLALDQGARRTLQILASHLCATWLEPHPDSDSWATSMRGRGIELLVCGTSDSAPGREAEVHAQRAARALGIPTVVIEDFPGNFAAITEALPRLLCVESEFAAALARRQAPAVPVHIGPAIRYDELRKSLDTLRRGDDSAERAVLWIGQPETEDALRSLAVLLPALRARGMQLWLRAHARDAGYDHGAYANLDAEDVSSLPLEECLARRPRLVITQFSSVAIEAGFWGIPSLNVLFPDAGGKTLAAKKGYSVPPWCDEGAAFLLVDPPEIGKVLDRALGSIQARHSVMHAFDRYFKVREEGAPALIDLLYNQGLL